MGAIKVFKAPEAHIRGYFTGGEGLGLYAGDQPAPQNWQSAFGTYGEREISAYS